MKLACLGNKRKTHSACLRNKRKKQDAGKIACLRYKRKKRTEKQGKRGEYVCEIKGKKHKADKVFSFQLKTYFLKALHFVNFKNSEIKRVTRLEYANCNERNLFIEKCCIKAISIYIDIFLKDHIIVVGKTIHSLLL